MKKSNQFANRKIKYLKICLVLLCSTMMHKAYTQITAGDLVVTHSVTTIDMTGLTATTTAGALAFNTNNNRIYEFDGTNWFLKLVTRNVVPTTILGNYTLSAIDNNAILAVNSAVDVTITVPFGIAIGPSGNSVGYNVLVYQVGTGRVTIIPPSTGPTTLLNNRLNRFTTAGQFAGISIISTANNVFQITGDLRQ